MVDTIFILDSIYADIDVEMSSFCVGDTAEINISIPAGYQIEWFSFAVLSLNPDSLHVLAAPTTSTDYIVRVNAYGSGCPDLFDTISVNIIQPPIVTLPDTLNICEGSYGTPTGSISVGAGLTPTYS